MYQVELLNTKKKINRSIYKQYYEITQNKKNIFLEIDLHNNTIYLYKQYKSKQKAIQEAKRQKQKYIGNTKTQQKEAITKTSYILYLYDKKLNDIKYLLEFDSYQTAKNYLQVNYNIKNIKDNITKDIDQLKLFKNNMILFKELS